MPWSIRSNSSSRAVLGCSKISNHFALICAMALFLGCSPNGVPRGSRTPFKKITKAELIQARGQPVSIDSNLADAPAGVELLNYGSKDTKDPQDTNGLLDTYQVEAGMVVTHQRSPVAQEAVLQYWLHLLKDQTYTLQKLEQRAPGSAKLMPESRHAGSSELKQLISKQAGLSVIYDPVSDRVLQVIEYEVR
jgi:hypothetical protein